MCESDGLMNGVKQHTTTTTTRSSKTSSTVEGLPDAFLKLFTTTISLLIAYYEETSKKLTNFPNVTCCLYNQFFYDSFIFIKLPHHNKLSSHKLSSVLPVYHLQIIIFRVYARLIFNKVLSISNTTLNNNIWKVLWKCNLLYEL